MMRSIKTKSIVAGLSLAMALILGCGADQMSGSLDEAAFDNSDNAAGAPGDGDELANDGNEANDDGFVPEEEEFLVQQVAATESYVFVPNQTEGSDTVALIDGRDFSVHPMQVGRQPERVVAMDVEDQGPVAYVLSSGDPTVAIIRADLGVGADRADVRLLPVPWEVNQLAISPDGRHVLAHIDPSEPINASASTASLQTMALIRLGDEPGEDQVFQLSVTRLIDDIAFTADGEVAFVVGQEGINRIPLYDIKDDAFLPSLDLGLATSVFPPQDREVAISSDGQLMALRTSDFEGVGLFRLDPNEAVVDDHRLVDLGSRPTDVEMVEGDDGSLELVATLRMENQVVLFDIDEAMEADDQDQSFLRVVDASGADAGIGRLTPDGSRLVVFSTLPLIPRVGLIDLETELIEIYELRNEIRSLAISPDSETAVVIHQNQGGSAPASDPEAQFRNSEGLTLWDLASGYRRPLGLRAYPEEIIMTSDDSNHPYLFVMLTSDDPRDQGILRIDLITHRTDFVRLPRQPLQLGVVADKVFVSQEEETGRITFFDVATNEQRTVSGYELNAGIQ